MKVLILPAASEELYEAAQYYYDIEPGLANHLLEESFSAMDWIRKNPNGGSPFLEGTRKINLDRFPYGLVYVQRQEVLVVVAIAELHRKPGYWKDRLVE